MLKVPQKMATKDQGIGLLPVVGRYRALLPSVLAGLLMILCVPLAQAGGGNQCFYDPGIDYFWLAEGQNPEDNNCQGNSGWRCYRGEVTGVWAEVAPGCDPAVATCTTQVHASLLARGVRDMVDEDGLGGTPTPAAYWFQCAGAGCGIAAICGVAGLGGQLDHDSIDTWAEMGLSCASALATDLSIFFEVCPGACTKETTVELPGLMLAQEMGCLGGAPPPPYNCGAGDGLCRECLPVGAGGASTGGEPPGAVPPNGGPGAFLRYSGQGVGWVGTPGFQTWRPRLGRGWSHDYAERIELDPVVGDTSDVWLLTRYGTFRHFTSLEAGAGLRRYQAVAPSDEKRALYFDTATGGWELHELDGAVSLWDSTGSWLSTTDRNGNETMASYAGGGELIEVAKPDGRSELFAYHPSGKLASITEVGVGVSDCALSPSDCRTWSYEWSGDALVRIDRPDGSEVLLHYDDARFPNYLTRVVTANGTGTGRIERLEVAYALDSEGRVIKTWRGSATVPASSPPVVNGGSLDVWSLSFTAFGAQGRPSTIEVTDPVGGVSTRQIGRDPVSDKPRLESVAGDCPVCSSGPNSQLLYDDPVNPLLPTEEIEGDGERTLFSYTADGLLDSRTEAAGTTLERVTTWEYHPTFSAFPNVIEGPTLTGATPTRRVDLIYDATAGDLLFRTASGDESTWPTGSFVLTTAMSYNGAGRVETINPPGYDTPPTDVTSFTYAVPGTNGLLADSRTDPLTGTTVFGYDLFNRRTSVIDPNGVTSDTEFDALNRVVRTIQRGPDPLSEADDLITRSIYNGAGELVCQVLPAGNAVEYVRHSATGEVIEIRRGTAVASPTANSCLDTALPRERTRYLLDGLARRTNEKLERSDGPGWILDAETTFAYSTRCHLDSVTKAPGTAQVSTTEYAYDCSGNLERVWDANHPSAGQANPATQVYGYDALDRLESVTQPWTGTGDPSAVTGYGYDAQDHLTSVTDAEGNQTTYLYSDRDLLTEEVSPVSGTSTHGYNEHGELITSTDARLITTLREVDAADRVTAVTYPDSSLDVTYGYDTPATTCMAGEDFASGRLTSITRHGGSVDYCYDRFGRPTRDGSLTYTYDANGNRSTIGYPMGVTAQYSYDFADRATALTAVRPGEPDQPLVMAASYLASGPLEALTLGNGVTEDRDFDRRYYPDRLRALQSGTLLDWDYTVDRVGNTTQIADLVDSDPAHDRVFAFQEYQYFLVQGDGPWGELSWSYDRIGNRLSETRDSVTDTYQYVQNSTPGNTPILDEIQLGATGTHTFTFGPAGHQIQVDAAGNVVDFTYGDDGRLSRIERSAATASVDLQYDGRSFLEAGTAEVLTTAGGAGFGEGPGTPIFADDFETGDVCQWDQHVNVPGASCPVLVNLNLSSTYDSAGLLHARSNDSGDSTLFYFAGRPLALLDDGSTFLYLTTDHLGTPILATDEAGAEVWQGGFEPFGEDYAGAQNAGVFLRFPGQWDDLAWQEASLGAEGYYNVHRWYQPGTGRYGRVDPIRWRGSTANTYIYAENQPLLFVDRFGLAPVRNNSGIPIPYKPENGDGVIMLCAPGQSCDADGVFPPSCSDFPIKIVNGCTVEVRATGALWIFCPLFNSDAPGLSQKFPVLGQLIRGGRTNEQFHRDHPDWPVPNRKPFCGCEPASPPQVPVPGGVK